MKLVQGNTLTSLESVRRFLDDNQAVLDHVISTCTRQKLDEAIAELSSTATAQNQFTRDLEGAFATKASYRAALIRDHMVPIAKIASLELSEAPALVKLLLPKRRASDQQLGALADGMAEAARPYTQVFLDAGRKRDFIDRLKAAADQMRSATYETAQSRARIKKTTSGLTHKHSRGRKVVHMLDAFVKEAVGNDKALLDSWNTAKRVVRPSGVSRTTTNPAGSTPSATTPATTTTAAAA